MGSAKLWNTRFAQLFCIEATLQFGLYLTRPLIAGYAVSLGASLTLAGFLAGLLAAAALAARPASGIVADRLGKKDLLSVSCGLFAVSALGCALFRSIPLMALFLTLQGFAFAFKSTVVVSLASLVVPEERVGSGVGWLGGAYTIACALGPAFGSLVGDMAGYAGAFATSGALLSAGFVMAVLFKTPPAAEVRASSGGRLRGKPSDWLYGPALPLSAIAGLLMVAQGVTSSFVLVVGEMRGIEGAPLYFLLYSFGSAHGATFGRWGASAMRAASMGGGSHDDARRIRDAGGGVRGSVRGHRRGGSVHGGGAGIRVLRPAGESRCAGFLRIELGALRTRSISDRISAWA